MHSGGAWWFAIVLVGNGVRFNRRLDAPRAGDALVDRVVTDERASRPLRDWMITPG